VIDENFKLKDSEAEKVEQDFLKKKEKELHAISIYTTHEIHSAFTTYETSKTIKPKILIPILVANDIRIAQENVISLQQQVHNSIYKIRKGLFDEKETKQVDC